MTELFTVFGADGFVGRRLVQRLTSEGHHVQAVGRNDRLDAYFSDLGNVMYCVGVTGSRFKTEQFRVVDAHVSSMARVLEHGRFSSFLYMSSARMYEESITDSTESARFGVVPSNISDFYNLSKLMGESILMNSGVANARIVRVSYAVDFAEDSTDNLTEFIRSARRGEVNFLAHPDSTKDYIVMGDILDVMPRIALSGTASLYNVASGMNTSTREIGEVLEQETGCAVTYLAEEALRSPKQIDIGLLKSEFSFKPQSVLDYARRVLRSENLS